MSQINVSTIRNRTGGPPSLDQGVVVTGIVTATTGEFAGDVTVGGTLTYEDVTNIDSVGIITARDGLKVLAGGANIVGVVTATSYQGSGAALTDLNASSFSTGTGSFNLEVESRGKLPKGLKAIVNARCTANDSGSSGSNVIGYLYPGSGYENGVAFDIGSDGLTLANDDQYKFFQKRKICDSFL